MTDKRSKTWLADQLRKIMPGREELASNRYLAPIAHRFLSPELWRFTRRSVPRGVALGLFAAFIVPLGQIFLAAFLALPARANVPLAAAVTFVTNPFTFPFWAWVAKETGDFVLDIYAVVGPGAVDQFAHDQGILAQFFELAGVTAFGFVVLSVMTPVVGYVLSGAIWRVLVARRRSRRLQLMVSRLDQRLGAHEE
ncbi:MAG: hypothetical protein A3J40_01610 [Erythrobacter sp. RIFCSPHIGHO2_12_FULL_63_10]|nr:MAG: hypothetical protein A3J40_01610 [Erythrobacter sp. RIFCSPHIGHO2_12_FULL_63_10]